MLGMVFSWWLSWETIDTIIKKVPIQSLDDVNYILKVIGCF